MSKIESSVTITRAKNQKRRPFRSIDLGCKRPLHIMVRMSVHSGLCSSAENREVVFGYVVNSDGTAVRLPVKGFLSKEAVSALPAVFEFWPQIESAIFLNFRLHGDFLLPYSGIKGNFLWPRTTVAPSMRLAKTKTTITSPVKPHTNIQRVGKFPQSVATVGCASARTKHAEKQCLPARSPVCRRACLHANACMISNCGNNLWMMGMRQLKGPHL